MPTEITVTGCGDCTFANDDMDFSFCMHPKSEIPPFADRFDGYTVQPVTVTIELKQDDPQTTTTAS